MPHNCNVDLDYPSDIVHAIYRKLTSDISFGITSTSRHHRYDIWTATSSAIKERRQWRCIGPLTSMMGDPAAKCSPRGREGLGILWAENENERMRQPVTSELSKMISLLHFLYSVLTKIFPYRDFCPVKQSATCDWYSIVEKFFRSSALGILHCALVLANPSTIKWFLGEWSWSRCCLDVLLETLSHYFLIWFVSQEPTR